MLLRKKSKKEEPEIGPPPAPDVWSSREDEAVHYLVPSPWEWVMEHIANEGSMEPVATAADLPSAKKENGAAITLTPSTRRRRASRKAGGVVPSTLKIEISDASTGEVAYAAHGTSAALDGLEDKDELVRTMQRSRCEHLLISPPSVLINWDVTREECLNLVGDKLPALEGNKQEDKVAVLKEPMGSQGKGIYFVRTAEEIHMIIDEHRQRATEEPEFLDNLIAMKGRIPSWVLQAEVVPPLLIRNGRKFHIRTYLALVEKLHSPDLLEFFIYNRHEIRVAGVPVNPDDKERDSKAHITNGALSTTTERVLLTDVPELVSRGLQEKVEVFVAKTFAKHFLPDITRRVSYSVNESDGGVNGLIHKFALAALDLVVTEDNQIFLLEVNVNPAAPPAETVDDHFTKHLEGFLHDLINLAVGAPCPNFLPARDILEKHGLLE